MALEEARALDVLADLVDAGIAGGYRKAAAILRQAAGIPPTVPATAAGRPGD
jgi:hypothetical protein